MVNILKIPSFELAVYIRGDPNAKKLALVLPGRLDTKDYAHTRSHVEYLASRGYLALSFDPPGTWESPGDISIYTMTNYLRAVNELITYFGNRPTILMGHSRGGSMAMLAGTQNSYVTHIITAMSSPMPSKMINTTYADFELNYRDTPSGGQRRIDLPLTFFEDAAKYHLLDALTRCTKPKLYILGLKDSIIVPASIIATYEKSAAPKKIYEVDSDHDYRFHPEIIEEINLVMGEFLTNYS